MQVDRAVLLEARAEVLALHHARQRVAPGQAHQAYRAKRQQPAAVVIDDRLSLVQHLPDLALVGLGVGLHLLRGELGARRLLAGGIADERGEVADQEDHAMAELLEVPHLAQQDGVPEVEVGSRGVEAGLDGERLAGARRALELGAQLRLVDQVDRAARQQLHLVGDRRELAPARPLARDRPGSSPLHGRAAYQSGQPAAGGEIHLRRPGRGEPPGDTSGRRTGATGEVVRAAIAPARGRASATRRWQTTAAVGR